MTVLATSILVIAILIIIFGSRQCAILAFAFGILYLSQGAAVEVFGFNLFAHRFLQLFGFIRVNVRREINYSKLNSLDWVFISLYAYTAVVFILRGTGGYSYLIGVAVDATLSYFTFRALIHNMEDFKWFLNRFVFLLIPYFALVLIERLTFQNPFALVGANSYTVNFRQGIPRCTGSFRHAILLGSFGTSFLPIYVGLIWEKSSKNVAIIGIVICLALIFFSNSGGPASSFILILIGWCAWLFRKQLRLLQFIIFAILVLLSLIMEAPIWSLPAKISGIVGGSGWHRFYLIDMTIRNFDKWWAAGMPISETSDWFPYMLFTGGADITNEFVSFGINAGIVSVFLFILLLFKSFQIIGKKLSNIRAGDERNSDEYLIWGVGVMLLVHISNWFGVTYYDQMKYVWFMQLSIVAMLDEKKIIGRINL
jgi:hypothetical protein